MKEVDAQKYDENLDKIDPFKMALVKVRLILPYTYIINIRAENEKAAMMKNTIPL